MLQIIALQTVRNSFNLSKIYENTFEEFTSSNFFQSTVFSTISIERAALVYMNFKTGQVNLGRQRL